MPPTKHVALLGLWLMLVRVMLRCTPDLTMIQVYFIQMDDYPAYSCAISPTAFLFLFPWAVVNLIMKSVMGQTGWCGSLPPPSSHHQPTADST